MKTGISEKKTENHDSRELVLAAALRLFSRQGYDGTSIDDIRRETGFKSKASLYTHFRSKEEVATALLLKWQEHNEQFILGAYYKAENDTLKQFIATGRAIIVWALEHPDAYSFSFLRVQQEKLVRGQYDYLSGQRPTQTYPLMLGLLVKLRQAYPVRPIADAALLSMVVGLISKAVIDQEAFGPISRVEMVEQILQMCFGIIFSNPVEIN
jgi:AcrR family transcriptional regulator